ncbi:Dipeptide transport system permease protein DppC (plasmid) [Pediococcus acidilactici]|uniref:ABC transporter permease n=1 Tax=Pediococcus acidilactici TaxID=1254 RepID=UPI0007F005D3|nr:ABC transporter permease [Pediococcus acidilactici]ARW25419.1 Dipeptide transport system permease protein DppC [Pediococcus acidilactici]ARW27495.1 Dipeptide transport system permease protein DppC [Pediococcus acidilactici]ARW29563.1 Dipeptide transport system permease protein DppC [Pediococcus acidilactici]OBR30395.1 Dipeptide transport system permease protein DppC [Pediococcus acidilactici]QAR71984.1 ABC transporter permease [Pediococcus acidilactici]
METTKLSPDAFKHVKVNTAEQERIAKPALTFSQDAMRRLKKNKAALISLWILIIIAVISILSLWLSPSNPNKQNLNYSNLPPKWPGVDLPGLNGYLNGQNKYAGMDKNVYYLLGTDYLGRDLLSRIMVGTRVSLFIGIVATFFDLTIGVFYGIISGWRGGMTDTLMQRVIEIISSVPNLVVVILMLQVFKPGMTSIILAIALTGWVTMARLIRAQTLQLKDQEFVLAARTLGESSVKIAFKHLIPNLSSIIIIQTMFTIPTAIFFEAFLSYIGIGLPAPTASLGTLLSDGQKNLQVLPYQLLCPAIVIVVLMLAFNLLADGLRDAFDPRSEH